MIIILTVIRQKQCGLFGLSFFAGCVGSRCALAGGAMRRRRSMNLARRRPPLSSPYIFSPAALCRDVANNSMRAVITQTAAVAHKSTFFIGPIHYFGQVADTRTAFCFTLLLLLQFSHFPSLYTSRRRQQHSSLSCCAGCQPRIECL